MNWSIYTIPLTCCRSPVNIRCAAWKQTVYSSPVTRDVPESKSVIWENTNNAMETDNSSYEVSRYYSGKKKPMSDMSVCQPWCFFRSIHIMVDGHRIKIPILFATQDWFHFLVVSIMTHEWKANIIFCNCPHRVMCGSYRSKSPVWQLDFFQTSITRSLYTSTSYPRNTVLIGRFTSSDNVQDLQVTVQQKN